MKWWGLIAMLPAVGLYVWWTVMAFRTGNNPDVLAMWIVVTALASFWLVTWGISQWL